MVSTPKSLAELEDGIRWWAEDHCERLDSQHRTARYLRLTGWSSQRWERSLEARRAVVNRAFELLLPMMSRLERPASYEKYPDEQTARARVWEAFDLVVDTLNNPATRFQQRARTGRPVTTKRLMMEMRILVEGIGWSQRRASLHVAAIIADVWDSDCLGRQAVAERRGHPKYDSAAAVDHYIREVWGGWSTDPDDPDRVRKVAERIRTAYIAYVGKSHRSK